MFTKKKKEAQSCNFIQTLKDRALFPSQTMCVCIYIEQSCQNHLVLVNILSTLFLLSFLKKQTNVTYFFGSSTLTFSLLSSFPFTFSLCLSLPRNKKKCHQGQEIATRSDTLFGSDRWSNVGGRRRAQRRRVRWRRLLRPTFPPDTWRSASGPAARGSSCARRT